MSRRLFVGNLGFQVTREQLTRTFDQVGEVVSVSIPVDRDTQQPRGFAFVEFSSSDEAERALEELDGTTLEGRPMRLSEAIERGPRRDRAAEQARPKKEAGGAVRDAEDGERGDVGRDRYGLRGDDYAGKRRGRPRKGGRHGSDRKRGRGTRRTID